MAFSSNTSLCGAFNTNVLKAMTESIQELKKEGAEEIEVFPIGAKVAEKAKKMGYSIESDNANLLDRPNFFDASKIAAILMERFLNKEIDKVVIVYNHFESTSHQVLTKECYLPIKLETSSPDQKQDVTSSTALDYIIEPSIEELIESLIPKVLNLKIFTATLDSCASEHSARVIAMQTATDNADELLDDLTLTYNKTRQAAITTELLDIVGGSFQ